MRSTFLIGIVMVLGGDWMAAGQQRPTTLPPPPERPERLMQAQQLVWEAYPELQKTGLQVRAEERPEGLMLTFGEALTDRDDVLGLSRPRAALLVGAFGFDGNGSTSQLSRAMLTGLLTHIVERRKAREFPGGWTAALEAEKASFGPGKQTALLEHVDVAKAKGIVSRLQVLNAQFKTGAADEPLYWEVTATGTAGESIRLAYEPYQGRLIRFERVAGAVR